MAADREFELYKLLVEEVREVRRARRDLVNVFTTLNLGGVGALGFLSQRDDLHPALLIWLVGALVLICVIWRMANAYYTRQLAVKYEIIYEHENALGIEPMQREWKGLPRTGPMRFFSVERLMPLLFVIGYLVFLAYQITWVQFTSMIEEAARPLRALGERWF